MKSLALLVLMIAAASPLALHAAEARKEVVWNNPVQFTEPGLTHHSFKSAAMQTEIGYSIWLPPGYESSKTRYPVIYFLHGASGTESADAPAFSHMVAERVAAGKIPPAIVVFPNGGMSGYRDLPDSNVKVETMLLRELIPLVDRDYRTRTGREDRVLGGFSMGGGGSVRLGLLHPELFSASASWAGAFFRRNGDNSFVPTFETEVLSKPGDRIRLLMIVGYEDLTYPAHVPALAALQAAKYPFTIHTIADLGHQLDRYYRLTGDEFITFLTAGFSPAKAN